MRYVTITCEDLIAVGAWQTGWCTKGAHQGETGSLVNIQPWKRRPHFPDQGLHHARIRSAVCTNAAQALYKLTPTEWACVARVARNRERSETARRPDTS